MLPPACKESTISSRQNFHYAHTLTERPRDEWQTLEAHLQNVADLSGHFARSFGCTEWGRAAGAWHDLGKYSDAFQNYLRSSADPDPHLSDTGTGAGLRVDHSTAGAQHAVTIDAVLGHVIAYGIAGHHAGLLDGHSDGPCQAARLKKNVPDWRATAPADLASALPSPPRILLDALSTQNGFASSFLTRMLFSCLVDADFLDTEAFLRPEAASERFVWPSDILERMASAVAVHCAGFPEPVTPVNRQRARVLSACIDAAELPPGLFSLTVPTGGGKTLSSLSFALGHAVLHGLRRVVYVVPFTTIIEQNARVFRDALKPLVAEGLPDPVLEHHSNLDCGGETTRSRLASENWDAPLVVTTSVQFYESLFAARSSRCRKLHRLARAVIILDEVQTLPVDFLEPCLRALDELARSYGTSIVLCTATQPAVHYRPDFKIGLSGIREIAPDPPSLYQGLRRVTVSDIGTLDDRALASRLRLHDQVLCIVNTRRHARAVYTELDDPSGSFHLSALMCPEHRSAVLAQIHERLESGATCRVVSTQLIEAGVDIDFPTVYRSLAGLDAIAQAAGRCNRNGKLHGLGDTFVFRPSSSRAEAYFADTAGCAAQVLPLHEDPLSLEAIDHYFRLYYWDQASRWDARHICTEFQLQGKDPQLPFAFGFRRVAEAFQLIEDTSKPVIVPWGPRGRTLCDSLRSSDGQEDRTLLRRLQRFTVTLPDPVWSRNTAASTIELVHDRFPVLVSPELHYSERIGLDLDGGVSVALIS